MAQSRLNPRTLASVVEKMLRVLEAQKRLGGAAYPLTIKRLAELTDPNASKQSVLKTIKTNIFRSRALAARQDFEAPVVLLDDVETLAHSPLTLDYAFDLIQTKNRVITVAALKKKLTSRHRLQQRFQAAVNEMLAKQRLPAHVGWISTRGNPGLFRLQDLQPAAWRRHLQLLVDGSNNTSSVTSEAAAPALTTASGFARQFDAVFDRLNDHGGAHNLVSLSDLRREMSGYARDQFDRELRQLRLANQYSLSGAESSVSEEQQASGIHESGSLLLYVSRRHS
jgi:hypothetical protein